VDFGSTPFRILLCQAPDQDANFLGDSRSATAPPEPPAPIEAETGTMPTDDGVWVHNDERFGPAGPELSQQDPEQPIRRTQARSGPLPLEHSKLLAKGEHFEGSVGAAADEHPNHDQESEEE